MAEIPELGESDWEEEDLLTLDEAGVRLREELANELASLATAGADDSTPRVLRARARIAAIRSRLSYIDEGLAQGVGTLRKIPRS
ncbi:hypothetical protein [Jatrophihabitans sp.]|uniref:hypothetical protein n=1 Tax=Jatrophihabitans sp. TaxID=1932789 RepID=UPI0030C69388|nr:hypothetical protein [Jatrophihabitans sp.]